MVEKNEKKYLFGELLDAFQILSYLVCSLFMSRGCAKCTFSPIRDTCYEKINHFLSPLLIDPFSIVFILN